MHFGVIDAVLTPCIHMSRNQGACAVSITAKMLALHCSRLHACTHLHVSTALLTAACCTLATSTVHQCTCIAIQGLYSRQRHDLPCIQLVQLLSRCLTAAVHFLCKVGWEVWQAVLIRKYGFPRILVIVVLPTTSSPCHMAADGGPLCAIWRLYSAPHPSAAAL